MKQSMLPPTNLPYRTTAAYCLSTFNADWRFVRTGAFNYELNPVSFKKKKMKDWREEKKEKEKEKKVQCGQHRKSVF